MRRWITLSIILPVLPLILGGCNKVTGGGQMTCIGPREEVGLYIDSNDEDPGIDLGLLNYGGIEYDRCTFGFTAQPTEGLDARGQVQLVDHTQKITFHAEMKSQFFIDPNGRCAEYYAFGMGDEVLGQITFADGSTFAVIFVDLYGYTGSWALMDETVRDDTEYPEWPYHPTIEEGCGDVFQVGCTYTDDPYDYNADWHSVIWTGSWRMGTSPFTRSKSACIVRQPIFR